jgi:hypothetical protein
MRQYIFELIGDSCSSLISTAHQPNPSPSQPSEHRREPEYHGCPTSSLQKFADNTVGRVAGLALERCERSPLKCKSPLHIMLHQWAWILQGRYQVHVFLDDGENLDLNDMDRTLN